MKNIIFRADSSSFIGTGHIMRDLVLASQYKDANIIFAVQDLEGNINSKISVAGYQLEILQTNQFEELNQLIQKYNADMLVIDHYEIDYKFEKKLKDSNPQLILLSFDDTYEKHYCDILLNHNISADKKRYKDLVPKDCELRCGSKYTLSREEFYQNFPKRTETKEMNILIAMGGTDSKNLNIKILDVLKKFDDIKIDVVTTTANDNLSELKNYVSSKENITLHVNSSEIAKLMHLSDFAILTPSVTVNEAYLMKLPFIAIKTENNQKEICEYLQKNNFPILDSFKVINLEKEVVFMIDKLKSQLINFIQLSLAEKMMILEWRNDKSVKKWMYNRNDITLEDHLQYIDSLNSRDDRIYFLVKNEITYLGVVDLTKIKGEESAELGIYINPKLRGYGTLLMSKIVEYSFQELKIKTLYANVYEKNSKAINLYKKFNFKTVDAMEDSNGKLQKMELKNENR